MSRGLALGFVVLTLALPGCQFIDLDDELEEMQGFSQINGTIEPATPSDNPIAVALFADALRGDQLLEAHLTESRQFRFDVRPGHYFIFAFEDRNRDFDYQPDEPAGYYGDPTAIVIGADAKQTEVRIVLREDLVVLKEDDPGPEADGTDRLPKLWAGRKNVGAVTTLADPRFDEEIAEMGIWQPLRYSLEVGPGLFLLEPYDPEKTPVLFVHGIGGSPRAWRPILDRLDHARFQPWVLSYASGLPLEANARYLFDAVNQLKLQLGFDRIFILAHSMGGLVSQAYIDQHDAGDTGHIELFVTLSTPWGGHDAAQLGVDYAPAVVPVWRDMAPGSAFLTALQGSRLPETLPYHLLFGYRGGGFPSAEANDGSVTVASQLDLAAQSRATRSYGFDSGHVEILSDPTVIRLINDLLEQADEGTNRQPRLVAQ